MAKKNQLTVNDETTTGILLQMDEEGNINVQIEGNGMELSSMLASVLDNSDGDENSFKELLGVAVALLQFKDAMPSDN